MRPAAQTTVALAFFLALSLRAQTNLPDAMRAAEREAVIREEQTIQLGNNLREANAAKETERDPDGGHAVHQAASHFSTVADTPKVEAEKKEIIAGLDETREILARQYMKNGELDRASDQVAPPSSMIPTTRPSAPSRRRLTIRRRRRWADVPSAEALKTLPEMERELTDVATLVQDREAPLRNGPVGRGGNKPLKALELDPANTAAPYYLDLLKEARYINDARNRERDTKTELEIVERTWLLSTTNEDLPHPGNAFATQRWITPARAAKTIMRKLKTSNLPSCRGLPRKHGSCLKGSPLSARCCAF